MSIRAVPGKNDLATLYPELAEEWHERNLPLTPQQVTCSSARKVWWICVQGHEWRAIISNRTKHGQGCPYCSGKRVIPGVSDLATLRPDLSLEWSRKNLPLQPNQVKTGSNKKVWWQCGKGHEWQATIACRALSNYGCPYCSGKKVLTGENDLATVCPELAAQWHERNAPLRPDQVMSKSNKKVWWRCAKGHEWQEVICYRVQGHGCPYCSGNKVLKGENDLASVYPALVAEWSDKNLPLRPDQVTYGSGRKVWWVCARGHEWKTMIAHRSLEGSGCPYCSGRKTVEGENDLTTLYPSVAAEWSKRNFPLRPSQFSPGSNKKVWWSCSKGHKWQAIIASRTLKGSGCPYCSGRKAMEGENDLATLYPSIAAEWSKRNSPLRPSQFRPGSNKKVWWQCSKGHEWQTIIVSRTLKGGGCPYCSGQKAVEGENDLATLYPSIAAEWSKRNSPLRPSQFSPGSNKKVWWQCSKGHEWRATVDSRTLQGCGCPYCAGQKVICGETDLATRYSNIAAEWSNRNLPLRPDQVTCGSDKKVWWQCSMGHEWQATVNNRTAGSGCPYCRGVVPWVRKQL